MSLEPTGTLSLPGDDVDVAVYLPGCQQYHKVISSCTIVAAPNDWIYFDFSKTLYDWTVQTSLSMTIDTVDSASTSYCSDVVMPRTILTFPRKVTIRNRTDLTYSIGTDDGSTNGVDVRLWEYDSNNDKYQE